MSQIGTMPSTSNIPEPPQHQLAITGEEETRRFVDSGYFEYGSLHLSNEYLIVRCGVCGHDSKDWGMMRRHAWMGHEHHFSSSHIGRKLVWRREDLPDEEAAIERPHVFRESRYNEEDNEWDQYLTKLKGDCPDETVIEIAKDKISDDCSELLIEHWPPSTPYPGSIEEGTKRETRFTEV